MKVEEHRDLEHYKDSPQYREVFARIEDLGLVEHAAHLDEHGYTVIPPELVAPEAFQDRVRQAVLEVHERRTGQRIALADIATASLAEDSPAAGHWAILTEDEVFQDAIMNPAVTAMAKYLCGNSVILSDLLCLLKQQHEQLTHPLHTDQHGTPPPLPPYAQVANVTWTLTDYTKDNGPVAIVPGSHRWGRYPLPHEGDFRREDAPVKPIPIEAAAGSLIVWHGTTWHGSFPRESAGMRMNLIMVFTRPYMRQIRDFRSTTPQEVLDRHPVEFSRLIGANSAYPFREGHRADPDDMAYMVAAGYNPWG